MDKLPPWTARNEREKRAMRDWAFDRIDEALDDANIAKVAKANKTAPDFRSPADHRRAVAIAEARYKRNVKPLRELHPDMADLIHPPKRGKGVYPRDKNAAVEVVANIKSIVIEAWREHYLKHHRAKDQLSAIEIAVAYVKAKDGIDVDDVVERVLKPSGIKPRGK